MSDVLKPCPFCGKAGATYNASDWGDFERKTKQVCCTECPCDLGEDWHTEEDAIKAWNTRTPANVTIPAGALEAGDVLRLGRGQAIVEKHGQSAARLLAAAKEVLRWAREGVSTARRWDELESAIAGFEAGGGERQGGEHV